MQSKSPSRRCTRPGRRGPVGAPGAPAAGAVAGEEVAGLPGLTAPSYRRFWSARTNHSARRASAQIGTRRTGPGSQDGPRSANEADQLTADENTFFRTEKVVPSSLVLYMTSPGLRPLRAALRASLRGPRPVPDWVFIQEKRARNVIGRSARRGQAARPQVEPVDGPAGPQLPHRSPALTRPGGQHVAHAGLCPTTF